MLDARDIVAIAGLFIVSMGISDLLDSQTTSIALIIDLGIIILI